LKREGLDSVLEEVVEAKGAVVEALAESGSGFLSELAQVAQLGSAHCSRVDFGNSVSTIKAHSRSVAGQE